MAKCVQEDKKTRRLRNRLRTTATFSTLTTSCQAAVEHRVLQI
ncbi:hypothetical protein ANO14919_073890 [Xylariales sp. No.14919]|nr:hypothetical protein ANO14919_073890 [Xylariales sp. No.14919]